MIPMSGPWSEGSAALRSGKPLEMTIGAASPLWFMFGAAAATGAAYWWFTQWARPVNLEAMMGGAAEALPAPAPEPAAEPAALQALVEPAFSAPALTGQAAEAAAQPVRQVIEAAEDAVSVAAAPAGKGKSKSRAASEPPPEA